MYFDGKSDKITCISDIVKKYSENPDEKGEDRMLRIIVDSGSSIKQDEREKYGVDILPLRVQMGDDAF